MGSPLKTEIALMRRSIAITAAQLAAHDHNPKSKDLFKKLEEPISMSFANETPLDDVLKYIKQATTSKTYRGDPDLPRSQGPQGGK